MGIPATGRQVTVTGIDIARVVGGKLVEHWAEMDTLGLIKQLGALSRPALALAR
jgi:predicted ester cyclase